MEFSEKVRILRKQAGLTQEELAEALFVSRTAISKWESGRGYPNIDSLKVLAKFFGVTIDELLSGDELLTIMEDDSRNNQRNLRDLVFGLLDCGVILYFFLPFFGQENYGAVQSVSLLHLIHISPYLRIAYFASVTSMVGLGFAALILQNCSSSFWVQSKTKLSLIFNLIGVLLFIISTQPYAASILFLILVIKVLLLMKSQ